MSARRVLYVCPNGNVGGAERHLELLVRHHDRSRFAPAVYLLNDGPLRARLESAGARCETWSGPRVRLRDPFGSRRAARAIAAFARAEGAALVHGVMSYGHVFGGAAARLAGLPAVWFQHGPCTPLDWVAARVPAETLFVNSLYTQRSESRFRPSAGAVKLVYPGVEPLERATFASRARELRAEWGASSTDVVFGLFGRITPLKGQLLFLDAAERLLRQGVAARFVISGAPFLASDQEYDAQVRARAKGMPVVFSGHVGEVMPAMSACDAVVNASVEAEGFGLTLAEAMMLEVPVIAPALGGPLEVVRDGVEGRMFPAGDAGALMAAMAELATDAGARAALGRSGRATALARFTVERMAREIEAEYERLLSV